MRLGQCEVLQLAAKLIIAGEPFDVAIESEYSQCAHVGPYGDVGGAMLQPSQSFARDTHALSEEFRRYPAP
nr:hypothetical protein [Paludibacterium sp.]